MLAFTQGFAFEQVFREDHHRQPNIQRGVVENRMRIAGLLQKTQYFLRAWQATLVVLDETRMRPAMTELIGFRRQSLSGDNFVHAIRARQHQSAPDHAQAFLDKKTPTFGSDVLQDFQRSHGVEGFIRKRQRLVLLDHYELRVVAEALDIAADDLDAAGIQEALQ